MIVTNTQNSVVVNSTNVEQEFSCPINAEIIQISRALSNSVINSNKKKIKAEEIGPLIPLYAVLDYCVSYLKNEVLSDSEKKELEEIISQLIFKMPCNANLADRCDGVFSAFYRNPLGKPTESLPDFVAVIQSNSKRDDLVLLLIRLYLLFLYKKGDAPGNIVQALNITQDILSGFQALPFPQNRDRYNAFFSYHLALLWFYLTKTPADSKLSLKELLLQVIKQINVVKPKSLQVQYAFLLSRPEWVSILNPHQAIDCLKRIENEVRGPDQVNIKLQIIYLKYEQILRNLHPLKNLNETCLIPMLKELIQLKMNAVITPSDYIVASSLISAIQIQIAGCEDKGTRTTRTLRSALDLMEETWKRQESSQAPLTRFAESHALKCKIDWVIYCIFAGDDKDYKKALLVLERWLILRSANPLNFLASEIRECLQNAKCPRLGLAFTPQTVSFLERFKLKLLEDHITFQVHSGEYYASKGVTIDIVEIKDSQTLWTLCKSAVVDNLQNQTIKDAESLLKNIFANNNQNAVELYKLFYSKGVPPFTTYNETPIIIFDIGDYQTQGINNGAENINNTLTKALGVASDKDLFIGVGRGLLYLDTNKIDEFVKYCLYYPSLGFFLQHMVDQLLEKSSVSIEAFLFTNNHNEYLEAKKAEISLSTIILVKRIIDEFSNHLAKFEGQPIYSSTLLNLHKHLLCSVAKSIRLQDIFSGDQRDMKRSKHWELFEQSQHIPTILAAAEQLSKNYFLHSKFVLSIDELFTQSYNAATRAIGMARSAVRFDKNKAYELAQEYYKVCSTHFRMVQNLEPTYEHIDILKLETIMVRIMCLNAIPDEEKWHKQASQFYNSIPATVSELAKHYQLKEPLSNAAESLLHIILLCKPFFLVQEQRVEEALKLQFYLHTAYRFVKKEQITNPHDVFFNIMYLNSRGKPILIKPSTLNKNPYLKVTGFTLPTIKPEKKPETDPEQFFEYQSSIPAFTKKEIQEESSQRIQREQEKEDKKRARVPSEPPEKTTEKSTLTTTVAPQPIPKLMISKKVYPIFEKLFTQNNIDEQGAWENRSYRSDVKISRKEALKLIRAFGGSYSESRGKGSHSLAHLSKLELNGVEIGICDFEEGEVLICFTKAADLKFYQLSQLRDALIKLGYTPDTVISE